MHKIDLLSQYTALYDPFVLTFCETWLESSVPSSFFCPPGYVSFRRDRPNRRGGGSLILVKSSVETVALDVYPSSCVFANIDAVACMLYLNSSVTCGILCLYRPPDSTSDDNACVLAIVSTFLDNEMDHFIIIGDFNYPDIEWPGRAFSSQSKLFLNFCQENFLQQHVTVPTRKSSSNVLDLVFTSLGTPVENLSVCEEFGTSDHSIVQFSARIQASTSKKGIYRRDFRRVDWEHFQHLLLSSEVEWMNVLGSQDIDHVWSYFLSSLNNALDCVAPYTVDGFPFVA